jgi:hypothetical protein
MDVPMILTLLMVFLFSLLTFNGSHAVHWMRLARRSFRNRDKGWHTSCLSTVRGYDQVRALLMLSVAEVDLSNLAGTWSLITVRAGTQLLLT